MWHNLTERFSNLLTDSLELYTETIINRFKQVGLGLIVLRLSLSFWSAALLMFMLALFFKLANLDIYVFAAFVTGSVSLILGVILTAVGLRYLRS